jgi:hypothetical protein
VSLAITLPQDLRGELALSLLPESGGPRGELMIFGEAVRRIDAWGGAALRAAIEYHARYLQRHTVISLPDHDPACALLHGLIRLNHPAQLVLPDDSDHEPDPLPRNVLLQAQPIASAEHAFAAADVLFDAASGRLRDAGRFAAKSLPELVQNALLHARRCPTPPVVCAIHDRDEDELQLVVVDLGRPRPAFDTGRLRDAVLGGQGIHGLSGIVEQAAQRELDLSLSLAAGSGRLAWRAGRWVPAKSDQPLLGFAAGITIPI